MHSTAVLPLALLALAAPSAALAMPSPAIVTNAATRAVAHQAAPAGAQIAIILQRKPPDRKPPLKRGR